MGRAHIDDHCKKSHCAKAMKELEACTERVNAKYANAKPGEYHCVGRDGVGREGSSLFVDFSFSHSDVVVGCP
jgi:hypothetical protein